MGDTCHGSLHHSFAKGMALPQTALLSLDASHKQFIELPFQLGYTWFIEHDFSMEGLMKSLSVVEDAAVPSSSPFSDLTRLPRDHPLRVQSLNRAVDCLQEIILALTTTSSCCWSPERVFVFGYSCGASLAAELALDRAKRKLPALGGVIAVAGGATPIIQRDDDYCLNSPFNINEVTLTPLLIIAGSKDTSFTSSDARLSAKMYDQLLSISGNKEDTAGDESKENDMVRLFIKQGKKHDMIRSKEEMEHVMQFFAKRLVRRMVHMEEQGWKEVSASVS